MESQQPYWQPILDGIARDQALEAIQTIAAELNPLQFHSSSPKQTQQPAGLALFFGYLARVFPDAEYRSIALEWLDQAIDTLTTETLPPFLYEGFTEVAWVVEHLQQPGIGPDADLDLNEEIDEVLIEHLNQSPWNADYDLLRGLVGFGVYGLERHARPTGQECLEKVLDRLEETAQEVQEGLSWFTGPAILFPDHRERYPDGYYNLGVAHGVPGVVGLLGQMYRAGIETDRTRRLAEGAVRWVLAQKLQDTSISMFPDIICSGRESTPTRNAWCYGDLGIAAILLQAARCFDEPEWEQQAVEIALHAAGRTVEQSRVVDTGLCHGAAGLAHVFNRLYQATRDIRFQEAAIRWCQQTLRMRQPGQGIAGFTSYFPTENRANGWVPDPNFLTGAAGIGLALLAAITPIEPAWDRLLLVSIPPGFRQ